MAYPRPTARGFLPAVALAGLLASPAAVAQPARDTAGGLFLSSAGGPVLPATRLDTNVTIDVTGLVARVAVVQRFRNDSDDWVEGIYVFPLPDDAAVDTLTMQIGDRRIEGEIQEREQARRRYERARAAGQQASLVEQERPNLFTTSVANIAPRQEIAIEIGYLGTVAYDDARFSLRFPMTLTPRFIPGASQRPDITSVPDAARITPPMLDPAGSVRNLASVAVTIDAGGPLAGLGSRSHVTTTGTLGERYTLRPAAGRIPMDRDFVVDWELAPSQSPRALAFTETSGRGSYALLMFLPPAETGIADATPRELIFVIDTSGSMGGASIEQARAALHFALEQLTGIDRFNVIEFNSNVRALFDRPVSVDDGTLRTAHRFVDGLSANGGTNIAPALVLALGQPALPEYLRQIVFMTDGSVGNEAGLFQLISERLGDARLFTVGIGAAPNSHFMRKAAQFGRGSHSHIARPDEVAPGMRRLFDQLGHVALRDIELDWPGALEIYPERVPDLYRGEPVVVAARLSRAPTMPTTITASGRIGQAQWTQTVELAPDQSAGVSSIWARRKIESLLDRRLEGAREDAIRADVVAVALEHNLLSPYTSLVAIDKTPERSREAALRREALGNMLPAGSDIDALFGDFPSTATSSALLELLGTVIACLSLGLFGIWRLMRVADGEESHQ